MQPYSVNIFLFLVIMLLECWLIPLILQIYLEYLYQKLPSFYDFTLIPKVSIS